MAVDRVSSTDAVALVSDPVPDRISQHALTAIVGDPVPDRIEQVQAHAIVSEPIPDRISNVEVLVFIRDNRYVLVGGPVTLQPGQRATIRVIANDDFNGLRQGELTINSNAQNHPSFKLRLSSTVVPS